MVVKTKARKKSRKLSPFGKLDAEAGRKMKAEDRKQGARNRKRLRKWTAISGSKEKTKWTY